jgi:hypothetical protein
MADEYRITFHMVSSNDYTTPVMDKDTLTQYLLFIQKAESAPSDRRLIRIDYTDIYDEAKSSTTLRLDHIEAYSVYRNSILESTSTPTVETTQNSGGESEPKRKFLPKVSGVTLPEDLESTEGLL